jgi:hypothetical protein
VHKVGRLHLPLHGLGKAIVQFLDETKIVVSRQGKAVCDVKVGKSLFDLIACGLLPGGFNLGFTDPGCQ